MNASAYHLAFRRWRVADFDGLMIDCPRIPSPGDHILKGEQRVRVERVLHDYRAECLQVSLLA